MYKVSVTASFTALLLFLWVSVDYFPMFFGRNDTTVTIIEIDAARSCRNNRSFLHGNKFRSERPKVGIFGYCGIVKTDKGGFLLTNSSRINLFRQSREEIFEQLKVGCTYRVKTFGSAKANYKNQPLQTRRARMVFKVLETKDCVQ